MKNRLPEKLTLLRKYYGYSQSDISEKLNIPVTEYMNWENGNSICNIQQLKKLADLFKVPLDAMADNTKTIVLTKKKEAVDNIDIPFMSGKTSLMDELDPADNMLPVDGVLPAREDSYTKKVPIVNEPEKLDETRVVDTQQFQTTLSNEIVDDIPTGAIEETTYVEPKDPEKKKNSIAVMLVAAIAVVAIAAIILLLSDHKQDINTLSDINRLAQGEGFTLYINQNGELETRGTFGSSGFNDLVQVSAFGTHAAGLKKNGTVVSNQKEGVSEWKDVTMIAAGSTHTVGLKKDGTVVCAGSDTACKVDEWTDIKSVYAGDSLTVAIDQNNALHACGKGEELLQNLKS
ncbi:MAG: helix-turn-helix domain-containing protein, partial [Solobacterium sp.]|nr:helix-turn-helix domain-containing protein [Solobacterium sp.]